MDTTLTTTSSDTTSGQTKTTEMKSVLGGLFFYYKVGSKMCLPGRNKLRQEGWR